MTHPPLLEVKNLSVVYPVRTGPFGRTTSYVRAVDGVNISLERGETLGLVGESGCGKSTLGRTILALQHPAAGQVMFKGEDLFSLQADELRRRRRSIQLIFQNPKACFDPRRPVGRAVRMALDLQDVLEPGERDGAVAAIFEKVGLRPEHRVRYPHEFSGGQLQRIAIARALILKPELVVCDEPVSALDVSVQAQVLNLLKDLQQEFALTLLFISHNLAVVNYIADRVAVMYYGRIVELASRAQLFGAPRHPYTRALLSAVPSPTSDASPDGAIRSGEPPDPAHLPTGCRFQSRCPLAFDRCRTNEPGLCAGANGHAVACWAAQPDFLQPMSATRGAHV
jgi:oligopeptide/dipeptide ABC transporter ATP-binding protein